ncbi:hypothetical protein GSI_05472 [Ganoderma sinense ZZ0214-1]|uniref:Integrase catalytic domain-containing protein n=1 Tax=Ganoderma sinense ZZ0214-1 TaxID=1077348 RepID=A0A2G8SEV3_9APHY|nr:hypothetical protein GSI_05472 [Ganoderma sinense ZZ0214-1]
MVTSTSSYPHATSPVLSRITTPARILRATPASYLDGPSRRATYLGTGRAPSVHPSFITSRTTRGSLRHQAEVDQLNAAVAGLLDDPDLFAEVPSFEATHNHLDPSSDEAEAQDLLTRSLSPLTRTPTPEPNQASSPRDPSPDLAYLNTLPEQWPDLPLARPNSAQPSFLPIFGHLVQQLRARNLTMAQPYRMPPRGASGAPSFDPIADSLEIVSDNGTPWIKALDYLAKKYGIRHIRISGYNSRANGIIERPHFDVRQALFKAAGGDQSRWAHFLHHVLWASRITIRRQLGCSPYFAVTGCHPVLPLDIVEATFLMPAPDTLLPTADLIGARARALARRQDDLARIHTQVYHARNEAARTLERKHGASIADFDFKRGALVLMRNTAIEKSLNRKMRPRYLGPYVVLSRNRGGAYILCELDGSVLDRTIAAFRLYLYDPRHVANVLRRCLEQPIMVTKEELLSMSPEFCASTRELCTTRKVPTEPVLSQDEVALPFASDSDEQPADQSARKHDALLAALPATFEAAQVASSGDPPPGTLVVPDPVDMYLKSLPADAERKPVKVSVESAAIRAIPGVFSSGTEISCIHDDGCSIVSMSEGVCHHLGLSYDPRVILQMQSANGACDYSLGLARNVPVRFGTITVYLQFHVIRSPAYDVLLGRPFDLLTSSIIHTKPDGSQTITLHDPNSDTVTTIPTAPRRPPEFVHTDPSRPAHHRTTVEDVPEDFQD